MSVHAIYPGSFDPLTFGHLDIIHRSAKIFGTLTILIANNTKKNYLFDANTRKLLVEGALIEAGIHGCAVAIHEGLLTDYIEDHGVSFIVRGLRAISDFESELEFTNAIKKLTDQADVVFLPTELGNTFTSSTLVKEIASLGGDVSSFAPLSIQKALEHTYAPKT